MPIGSFQAVKHLLADCYVRVEMARAATYAAATVAANGWLDERACALEALTAIKRAGADAALTYFALDAARWVSDRA